MFLSRIWFLSVASRWIIMGNELFAFSKLNQMHRSKVAVIPELVLILLSLFVALYLELFFEATSSHLFGVQRGILYGQLSSPFIVRLFLIAIISSIILHCLFYLPKRIKSHLFKWRYAYIGAFAVILIALEVSCSSVGAWSFQIGSENTGLVFGMPRTIRSDEFNASTLWNLSQEANGYQAISNILRGDVTDTRLVYNLASWSPVTIFRPLLWGYLLFGSAKGLSFYWVIKIISMFFASFEFARLLTRDDRNLSLFFSIIVVFSPISAWFGFSDLITYGELLVVVLFQYLRSKSLLEATIYGFLLAWLCGCYFFLLYPAWMVSFFYIFAIVGLQVLFYYVKSVKEGVIESSYRISYLIPLGVAISVVAVITVYTFLESWDAYSLTLGTVYPGQRSEAGGGPISNLLSYGYSIFFSISGPQFSNASEASGVFSLFPLPSIISIYLIIRFNNKRLIPLVLLQAAYILYATIGFPTFLSKITLLSFVPSFRMDFPIGYLEAILLLISLSASRNLDSHRAMFNRVIARKPLVASVILGIGLTVLLKLETPGFGRNLFTMLLVIALAALLCPIIMLVAKSREQCNATRLLLVAVFAIVLIPGVCVNPVQAGLGPVATSDLSREIIRIESSNPKKKWIVENAWQVSNLCTALGASTIGSTNAYPDLDLWKRLDPSEQYIDVYNRYCHINVSLDRVSEPLFSVIQGDLIQLTLNADALKVLDVDYVVSSRTKDQLVDILGDINLEIVASGNGFNIYEISD